MPDPKTDDSDTILELARSGDYSQVFNELVFRSLRPISLGVFVLYSIFVVTGFIDDHPAGVRRVVVASDAITAVIFLALYAACRMDLLKARWINPIALGITFLGTGNTLLAFEYIGDPFFLTYLPILIITYGALLLSLPWLLINTALVVVLSAFVVADDLSLELMFRYSPVLIAAMVLAVIILIVRRRGIVAAQQALVAARDELENRRAVEAQLAHSQRLDSLGKLVSGIAHEFNNLLMVIIGYADHLLDGARPDAPETEDLRAIRNAGRRAAALSGKLLAFSRQQVMKARTVPVNELVVNAKPLIERSIPGHVVLQIELDIDAGHVSVDPLQLEQVLLNLALNARDAMEATGGTLTIATAVADGGDFVEVRVSDSGEGMSQEVQERAFEPFFTTKPQGSGTGLGLATVYGIVTQSGGAITIDSAPGAGATVCIRLPLVEAAAEPDTLDDTSERAALISLSGTVLVIDDEPGVRAVVSQTLEQAGCRVLDADGGSEALSIAASERFDVILTDIVMPGMSGIELVRALRRNGHDQDVIYMSGHGAEAEARAAADGTLLRKPFRREELLGAVADVLTRASA